MYSVSLQQTFLDTVGARNNFLRVLFKITLNVYQLRKETECDRPQKARYSHCMLTEGRHVQTM
jgi:hypothetical protein